MQPDHHCAIRALALTALVVIAAAGCAGSSSTHDTAPDRAPATTVVEPRPAVSASLRLDGPANAHAAPDATAPVVASIPAQTELGSTTTVLVLDARDDWLEVALPIRPNGATGWVRADSGTLRRTTRRIDVDLSARTLTLLDGDEVVLSSPVAIGAPDTPTPVGVFSITDLVDTGDPDSDYGPAALGVSGHSDQLTEFAGGDGQVGIHGTNQPASIGQAASHGCIRLPNDVVVELMGLVSLGTPVTIR